MQVTLTGSINIVHPAAFALVKLTCGTGIPSLRETVANPECHWQRVSGNAHLTVLANTTVDGSYPVNVVFARRSPGDKGAMPSYFTTVITTLCTNLMAGFTSLTAARPQRAASQRQEHLRDAQLHGPDVTGATTQKALRLLCSRFNVR